MTRTDRNIIHIDMDAFYASVEQRDHPSYRGKPIVVGGRPPRGVVAAASYEARKYGIHSAMPSQQALKLCSELIFIKPRFRLYRQISKQIRALFHEYTHLVEPLSLDEAYLDITPQTPYFPAARDMAKELKQKIKSTTKLTASAGVAPSKFLAKLASDRDKPDGLTVIKPEDSDQLIKELPIEKFHGIGTKTAAKMYEHNIYKGEDLRQQSLRSLLQIFGKKGHFYYNIVRGIDKRRVNPNRIRKSIGAETTFKQNLRHQYKMQLALKPIAEKVMGRLEKAGKIGTTVTIKIKFADFQQITRQITYQRPIEKLNDLLQAGQELLHKAPIQNREVRLMGLTVSNLEDQQSKTPQLQLSL